MQKLFKSRIALVLASALAPAVITRSRTRDVAFGYRMGAGNAGDINRTHPFDVMPGLMDPTNPIAQYGFPCLAVAAAGTYRGLLAADQAAGAKIHGVLVRPYPTQQVSTSQALGSAVPPGGNSPIDIMVTGNIMVKVFAGTPQKRSQAFVWCAASSGNHVLGGFEAAATGGSTIALVNAYFNGPADANGITELKVFEAPLP